MRIAGDQGADFPETIASATATTLYVRNRHALRPNQPIVLFPIREPNRQRSPVRRRDEHGCACKLTSARRRTGDADVRRRPTRRRRWHRHRFMDRVAGFSRMKIAPRTWHRRVRRRVCYPRG